MLRRHWAMVLVLVAFCLLGLIYSVVNPLFESPDEVWHYEYVRWLVEGNGLPRPEQVGDAPWHQEGSQPPLYYLAAALLTKPIPTDNAAEVIRYNPHAAVGQPGSFGNKNVIVHGSADSFPWRGVALAAHMARFFSILLGAVTVVAAYGTLLAIAPGRKGLAVLAAALVAFNPQFIFLSAAVNNDNLVIAACSAAVWLLVGLLGRREPPPAGTALKVTPALRNGTAVPRSREPEQPDSRRAVQGPGRPADSQASPTLAQLLLLGLLVGVAALAKLSGLALAGLAGLTLIVIAVRRGSPRELIRWGAIVGAVALAVAGWWYWRNWQLYGDPLALQAMFDILPRRPVPPTRQELLARAQGVWHSAWAVFGWFNVPVPQWVYRFYTAISLAGLAGLVLAWPARFLVARRSRLGAAGPRETSAVLPRPGKTAPSSPGVLLSQLAILIVWIVVIFLALLNWAQMRYPQGRLLFPAISAAAVLISLGLGGWFPRRLHHAMALVLSVALFAVASLAPWLWIAPAYAPPAPLAAGTPAPNPVEAIFNGQIRLLGYEMETAEVRPGETLNLTLVWQALAPLPADFSVFVHLADEHGIIQAQRDSYPGAGNLPTGDWPVGPIMVDRHAIDIPETAPTPARLRVAVGLYDHATGERLLVDGADHWRLAEVALLPQAGEGELPNPVDINFDNQIALRGFQFDRRVMRPGDTLEVSLWWEALAAPPLDYVVFVHLILPPDATWTQSDQMPQQGAAPTSTWQPGQQFEDRHQLTLPEEAPPGTYFVEIGLYDPDTNDRLTVDFSDKGIVLGQVKVETGPEP